MNTGKTPISKEPFADSGHKTLGSSVCLHAERLKSPKNMLFFRRRLTGDLDCANTPECALALMQHPSAGKRDCGSLFLPQCMMRRWDFSRVAASRLIAGYPCIAATRLMVVYAPVPGVFHARLFKCDRYAVETAINFAPPRCRCRTLRP